MAGSDSSLENDTSSAGSVVDRRGRPVRDLRISVTDKCNFRCTYCMPKALFGSDHAFLPRTELLSFEEITRVSRAFVHHGVTKLRITGGEPLVRRGIDQLIEQLAAIDGVTDISLTTNASLLSKDMARALATAGLKRVTVSLDAVDDAVFASINDVEFPVSKVLDGIDNANAAGLSPVKVNMVVGRHLNEDQILPMARHFKGSGSILRFIEFMDVGNTNDWQMDKVIPAAEIIDRINTEMPLEPAEAQYRGEVAARWRYVDGSGEIGVITSVTAPFCGDCTRARLSADGGVYTCLFATDGHDLRAMLRQQLSSDVLDDQLRETIGKLWQRRDDRYSELRSSHPGQRVAVPKVEMSYIGG